LGSLLLSETPGEDARQLLKGGATQEKEKEKAKSELGVVLGKFSDFRKVPFKRRANFSIREGKMMFWVFRA